ncbi:MAG: F0F1 ATP synthase subunit A [Acidobacteria bacterium]|nr:F0F1 ATP synthase subunit A [Acidobacteriota bacterium]MCC6991774.1 F0F1 ATP synthase subunit A [Acidobacteriota bacterium]
MESLEHPSPLVDLVNALLGPLGVHVPDYLVFCALIVMFLAGLGVYIKSRLSVDNPGTLQIILEDIVGFVVDNLENMMPHKGKKFLPLVGTVFIFILVGNLMGQIPGLGSPTSNVNVPFALALVVWLYYHIEGVKAQGLGNYLLHFAFPPGVPKAMFLLMLPIEIISHASRVMSLTLRLFGNIFGEHLVVLIIGSIVPFLAPLPMQALGLIVGPLQAFIFMLLAAIYLASATAVDEHH